jgi:DNA ligase-1
MIRVLLAPSKIPDLDDLVYPLFVSPKLDGVRAIVKGGRVWSRTGKLIPSYQVQDELYSFENYDGELIVGEPTAPNVYNITQSHVMSREKEADDLRFYVFDYHSNSPYFVRYEQLTEQEAVRKVPQVEAKSKLEVLELEELFLTEGYEGVMLRSINAGYKEGRATLKEGIIYKLKRFEDDEAEIIDMIEGKKNENPAEKDELGFTKRSSHKDGKILSNTLGAFIVRYQGQELQVAPGLFNHEEREILWDNKEEFIGATLKFRFFKYGVKDKPRFPRAIGFREVEND